MDAETRTPGPFYDNVITSAEKALAAARLVGLDEELNTLREYVNNYAQHHREEFDKIIKGMRLIMQMVVSRHRMGGEKLDETIAALEEATRDFREQFGAPDIDDV
jgi:hypothetical protein